MKIILSLPEQLSSLNPAASTISQHTRMQKLMKILKIMKQKRLKKPIKKTVKQKKVDLVSGAENKRFRIVNDDGSIKWGYTTTSGTFQVNIDQVWKSIKTQIQYHV